MVVSCVHLVYTPAEPTKDYTNLVWHEQKFREVRKQGCKATHNIDNNLFSHQVPQCAARRKQNINKVVCASLCQIVSLEASLTSPWWGCQRQPPWWGCQPCFGVYQQEARVLQLIPSQIWRFKKHIIELFILDELLTRLKVDECCAASNFLPSALLEITNTWV